MSATFLFPDSKDFSPDFKEVARYLGYSRFVSPDQDVSELLEKAAQEMLAVMKPQAVFEIYDLSVVECRDSGVSKPPQMPAHRVVSIHALRRTQPPLNSSLRTLLSIPETSAKIWPAVLRSPSLRQQSALR